jgi:hypothetical protein
MKDLREFKCRKKKKNQNTESEWMCKSTETCEHERQRVKEDERGKLMVFYMGLPFTSEELKHDQKDEA